MAKFDETPVLKDPAKEGVLVPPKLRENATAEVRCWPSKEKDTTAINLPFERPPDWQSKAIRKFGELLDQNKALRVFMDICVRCGACCEKGVGSPR